jgi:cyclopropane fatty-acyl-phospholipid synthase-like methyltransferase
MTGPDPRPLVERGYDAVADRYGALESEECEWPRMRWLRRLLAATQPGGRVLDVGCGNGVPATREMARAYAAVGVDISSEQVERARRNVPGADFIHGDLATIEVEGPFDAVSAFYVIEHLPREQHAAILRRFHDWLAPGGHLLMTIEPDDEPGKVGEWLGEPMYFSQYDAETTLKLIAEAGFTVVERAIEDQYEGDRPVTYMWVLARRR